MSHRSNERAEIRHKGYKALVDADEGRRYRFNTTMEIRMATTGKVIKWKAVVAWEAEKLLLIKEAEVALPQAMELHVKILYTALYLIDVYFWEAKFFQGSLSMKLEAVVAWEAGKPLSIEEVEVALPQGMEVRIKILYTALYHTDVYFWEANGQTPFFPRIIGS